MAPDLPKHVLGRLPDVRVDHEHRLGGNRDVAPIEDQAEHRRPGAVVAEEEEG
jgi:hypothetical protein